MKKNGILCILIAAALLVTSVAAISANDQSATINQGALQNNNNIIVTMAGDNATVGDQMIGSTNIQAQVGLIAQTDDINVVGGNISDSSYDRSGSGSSSGNKTATINQGALQNNNNIIVTMAGDNATVGDQMIGSRNIQAQVGLIAQTGDINFVGGDIDHSSYNKSGSGSSGDKTATIDQFAWQENTNEIMTMAGDNATVGDQMIRSNNIQAQVGLIAQTDDINVVLGGIDHSSYTKVGSGNSSGNSSGDKTASMNGTGMQFNGNWLGVNATGNSTVGAKMIDSANTQAQVGLIAQTDDINVVLGDIEDSTYTKVSPAAGPTPTPTPPSPTTVTSGACPTGATCTTGGTCPTGAACTTGATCITGATCTTGAACPGWTCP